MVGDKEGSSSWLSLPAEDFHLSSSSIYCVPRVSIPILIDFQKMIPFLHKADPQH